MIGFFVGLFCGGLVGSFAMALLVATRKAEVRYRQQVWSSIQREIIQAMLPLLTEAQRDEVARRLREVSGN